MNRWWDVYRVQSGSNLHRFFAGRLIPVNEQHEDDFEFDVDGPIDVAVGVDSAGIFVAITVGGRRLRSIGIAVERSLVERLTFHADGRVTDADDLPVGRHQLTWGPVHEEVH